MNGLELPPTTEQPAVRSVEVTTPDLCIGVIGYAECREVMVVAVPREGYAAARIALSLPPGDARKLARALDECAELADSIPLQ